MSDWGQAQSEELTFWTLQNYDIPKCYERKYDGFFGEFLKEHKDDYTIDIGCGAIAYSVCKGLTHLVLCDPLILAYQKLPKDKTNLGNNPDKYTDTALLYPDFKVAMYLNVLDHTEDPRKAFAEVCRVSKQYILFYCDLRDRCDACHPHEISMEFIRELEKENRLKVLKSEIHDSTEPGMKAYLAVYEKES